MAEAIHPAIKPGARSEHRSTAAQDRLRAQSERLAWRAYVRTLALQGSDPGPETNIIRRAVFKVWEQAFLAGEVAP